MNYERLHHDYGTRYLPDPHLPTCFWYRFKDGVLWATDASNADLFWGPAEEVNPALTLHTPERVALWVAMALE